MEGVSVQSRPAMRSRTGTARARAVDGAVEPASRPGAHDHRGRTDVVWRSPRDRGAGTGSLDRGAQRAEVERAVVPVSVDEERRRPADAGQVRAVDVALDPRRVRTLGEPGAEPRGVESE